MNKSAIFSHFSSILDKMIDNSVFFDVYFMCPTSIEDIDGSYDDVAVPENIQLRFGATRGCIIDSDYDYVVKFDVESDDIYGSSCYRECTIYNNAREKNFHQYFAEVEYLGSYTKTIMFYDLYRIIACDCISYYYSDDFDNKFAQHEDEFGEMRPVTISIPLYAYRKADPHWGNSNCDDKGEEYTNMARKINSPMRANNLSVAIDFVREYGEKVYQELTDFMYQENINDLHGGNIGDIDGHMVFIDYSGYHETWSSYDEDDE